MRKNKSRKGFTLTELIVVIVIIAILAAVLIPTYTGIVKKARISADTQLVKSMNDALTLTQVESGLPDTFTEVLAVIRDEGYIVENLTPTTAGYDIVWNQTTGYFSLLDDKGSKVYSPDDDAKLANKWTLWAVAHTSADMDTAYSHYLTDSFSATSSSHLVVSAGVDVGSNTDVLYIDYVNTSGTAKNVVIRSNGGDVTVNGPLDVVNHYGYADSLTITAVAATSYHECGSIKAMTLTEDAKHVVVEKEGYVGTLINTAANPTTRTIEVAGYVETVTGTAIAAEKVSGYIATNVEEGSAGNVDNLTVNITSLEELQAFRDRVNAGRTYENITINLLADIDLSGSFWTPIGIGSRQSGSVAGATMSGNPFKGIFDGHNHTVTGLTNEGYKAAMTYFATKHNVTTYSYGFFGIVADATIKNLTMTNVAINAMGTDKDAGGDSIGAVVGFCAGSITLDNCTVSGTVKGFDAVGGVIGRIYDQDGDAEKEVIEILSCTNNATVSANIKVAGIVGYTEPKTNNGYSCTIDHCTNNGAIETVSNTKSGFVSGIICYGGTHDTQEGITGPYEYVITNNKNTGALKNDTKYIYDGNFVSYIAQNCSNTLSVTYATINFAASNTNTGTATVRTSSTDATLTTRTVPLIRVNNCYYTPKNKTNTIFYDVDSTNTNCTHTASSQS